MKSSVLFSLAVFSAACLATPPVTAAESAATAISATTDGATCDPVASMTPLQRRLLTKAGEGADSLRGFISRTRGIYLLEMGEVVAWLDAEGAAQASCIAAATTPQVARR